MVKSDEVPSGLGISITVEPKEAEDRDKIAEGLGKLVSEDSSLYIGVDEETGQIVLHGVSELHLETTLYRLTHEYGANVIQGNPQVNYRETIDDEIDIEFEYVHKKQSGGAGQYAEVVAKLRSNKSSSGFKIINSIRGGDIPQEYIPGIEKGLLHAIKSGALAGYPVVDIEVEIIGGTFHDVDSSVFAFEICARRWFVDVMKYLKHRNKLYLVEPIMKVEVLSPVEYRDSILGSLNSRRGQVTGDGDDMGDKCIINANVPLSEMLGYTQTLRDMTQGRATFSAVFDYYDKVPINIQDALLENV